MTWFRLFRKPRSARVARDRLKSLLDYERALIGQRDLVSVLREEIIAVVSRHVSLSPDGIRVRTGHVETVPLLRIDVELPASVRG
ncbi:MAG: cell division topological specificity factor MinE [Pseudomonadota bacterium]